MNGYPDKVWLNGTIVNPEDARVSVFDRGFVYSDGLYEVMQKINGKLFQGNRHWDRLQFGLNELEIDFDIQKLPDAIENLLAASGLSGKNAMIYLQITRGTAPRKHKYPQETIPTCFMYALPLSLPPINNQPVSVITRDDFRWHRCHIKSISLLGNVMANEAAQKEGAYEMAFIRNGVITEASHCNVFFVKQGTVYTHPVVPIILNGITRQVVLDLCRELDIPYLEEAVKVNELKRVEEVFLTGTNTQIAAVEKVDEHKFTAPGPITHRLQQAFAKAKVLPDFL